MSCSAPAESSLPVAAGADSFAGDVESSPPLVEGLEKDETPTVSGASIPAESPEGVAVLAAGGGVASLAGSVGDSAGMTGSSSVIPLMAAGGIVLLVIAFSLTMVCFEKAFAGQR